MGRVKRTAAVIGIVALGVGLGVAGLATAAPTASPSPSATSSPSAGSTEGPGGRHDRAERQGGREGLARALAEKLDLDRKTVVSALREYRQANRPTTKPEPGTQRPARDDTAVAKALAEKLDVPEADVAKAITEIRAERKAAREAARDQRIEDRLAEAVTAGTLTQAEADAVKKAADAGIVRVGRR